MLAIVDGNSLACSVSARSDMLRRSSQTATGSPAKTSSTRMMVMESLLAKNPLIRSLNVAARPGAVGASCGGSAGYGAVATISASLSRSSALSLPGAPSVPIATFASSRGTLSCELRDRTDGLPDRLGCPCHPPRRESSADQRLRAREIVDQLEALAAGGGVGDHPVADFVRAVAGARKRIGQERGEPRIFAILELLDAGVIEFLVDPAHGRLADRVAQAAGADRRQIADEEVDPVIGRDDDEQIRSARLEAAPDLVEGGRQPVAVVARHGLPVPRDDRPMTGREHAHEISHRPSLSPT